MPSVIVAARVHWRAWRGHGPRGSGLGAVVLALHRHSSGAGLSWPGVETLAESCRIGSRQAQRHLKRLERSGWVRRELAGPGSSLYLLTIPEALADDLGASPLSREDLLRDLESRPGRTPERIRSAAERVGVPFQGSPDPGKGVTSRAKRGDTSDRKGVTSRAERGDIHVTQGVTHPTSTLYIDELLRELKRKKSSSSSSSSSFQSKTKTKTQEHRRGARARLRSALDRIPERSQGIARGLLGSGTWSGSQLDLAERILSESRPDPEPRGTDRRALADRVADRLEEIGVSELRYTSPHTGREELVSVRSWKLRERLTSAISRGGDSYVDPERIAAQIAAEEPERIRTQAGRARA